MLGACVVSFMGTSRAQAIPGQGHQAAACPGSPVESPPAGYEVSRARTSSATAPIRSEATDRAEATPSAPTGARTSR